MRLLKEQNMTPAGVAESGGIVIRQAAPHVTIGGNFVPLFARNFAGFAADTSRSVSEEGGGLSHTDADAF